MWAGDGDNIESLGGKMEFTFSDFKVEIDVEQTRNFYRSAVLVSGGCSCSGCRNYEVAVSLLKPEICLFFEKLGVDIRKVCEVYVYCTYPDGTLYYGGFYHLCGKIVQGESAWVPENENLAHWDNMNTYSITGDFKISFQTECNLLEDNFPQPVIQMEIAARLPWVLPEENDYPVESSN